MKRRIDAGRLHRVLPGVLAVGHPRLTENARLLAAFLAYGSGAAISHRFATGLWRLLPMPRGPVEVVTQQSHERRGTRRHRIPLLEEDITTRHGIPVTRPGRTLADLATTVPHAVLQKAVHEAQVLNLLPRSEVTRAIATSANRKGANALRKLLPTQDHHLRSHLERRFLALLAEAGIELPQTNALIEFEGHLHRVDAAWPHHRIAVELDGYGFHRDRDRWEADHEQAARLRRAGWDLQRFTWRQVTQEPEEVLHTVEALPRLGSRPCPPSSCSRR